MKIKPIVLFIVTLLPVIIGGGYNQYVALGLSPVAYLSLKIATQIVPILVSGVIAGLLAFYVFKKDISVSLIYSGFTFFCLLPIDSGTGKVFITFLLGSLLSLGKLKVKEHLFYLNPAVAGRLLIFLWSFPLVRVDALSGATPLAVCHIMLMTSQACHGLPLVSLLVGDWQGAISETSKIGIFIGAALLLALKLVRARVWIFGLCGAVAGWLILFYGLGYRDLPGLLTYLMMGSLLFGLVFMTTDLFTRTLTRLEYACYGFLVGFLCILLRVLMPFPEATLLSLIITQLLMLIYIFVRPMAAMEK